MAESERVMGRQNMKLDQQKQRPFMERLAVWLLDHRLPLILCIGILTAFFLFQASKVRMETSFNDLLPQNHPYVKVYNEIRDVFGGANVVLLAVTARSGDIYRPEILQKIKDITNEIDLVPGVNHHQVMSIASRKVKDLKTEAGAISAVPVMWPELPKDAAGIEALRNTIHTNDTIYGPLVSLNDQSALVTAGLSEGAVNYKEVFDRIRAISERAEDKDVHVQVIGEPILYGWVYHYIPQTYAILGFTIIFIAVLQYLYFGQLIGAIRPFISGTISATWGLGFIHLIGLAYDPLTTVILFLLTARCVSHSVQMMERYLEDYETYHDVREACIATFAGLGVPTFSGIMTDVAGILIVMISPMPMLQKLALVGGFWVMSIVVSELLLNLLIFSYLPPPRAMSATWKKGKHLLETWLGSVASWTYGRMRWATLAISVASLVLGAYYALRVPIGDVNPGSPILWSDSTYNKDAREVNALYPGSDQLIIVARGDEANRVEDPNVLRELKAFQEYLEEDPDCGGTQSITDLVQHTNMNLHEGDPKWHSIPHDKLAAGNMITMVRDNGDPGDLDRFVDYSFKDASIIGFYKDHRGTTIASAIARAKQFIATHPVQHVHFELAGGLIGVLAAANEEIASSQVLSITLALLTIGLICALTYRSVIAGILFIIPIGLTNALTFAYMAWKGIGLNVNTLPLAALGAGLGIDYAIYVVSRIIEEHAGANTLEHAIHRAIATSGRAVLLTAMTMGGGVAFWYFLSDLRFEGDMGLLLALWMFVSMLAGTIMLPALIYLIRPRFVGRMREEAATARDQSAARRGSCLSVTAS